MPQFPRTQAFTKIELLVAVAVLCLGGWLILPSYSQKRVAERRAQCLANLAEIGRALESYLQQSDRHWPYVAKLASIPLHDPPWPALPKVLQPFMAGSSTEVFRCPADRRSLNADSPLAKRFPRSTTWYETETTSYEWLWGEAYGGRKVGQESITSPRGFGFGPADQPLLADFEPFHEGDEQGSFNTLNADLKPRTSKDVRR